MHIVRFLAFLSFVSIGFFLVKVNKTFGESLLPLGVAPGVTATTNTPDDPGAILAQFSLPNPFGFINGRAIAFDGKNLWANFAPSWNPETHIYEVSTNGSLIKTLDIGVGVGALAWDSKRNVLWGGNYEFGKEGRIYTINPNTGAVTLQFTFNIPFGDNCFGQTPGFIDGLDYDTTTDTLWISDDGGRTVYNVSTSGIVLSSFSMSKTGFDCNSGIAFDGQSLWLVAVLSQQIVHADKNGNQMSDSFGTPGFFAEDIAYDSVSFAPKCALWANEATSGTPKITAFEAPCPAGKILDVPSFKQTDPRWAGNVYDHGKDQTLECVRDGDWTIGQCGCALTSIAMMLAFHGATKDPNGNPTTPATVNEYFNRDAKCEARGCISLGYRYGQVRWGGADQYSAEANKLFGTQKIVWNGDGGWDPDLVRQEINNDRPVILAEPGHYIVAKGIIGNTFAINDPAYNRVRLDQGYGNNALSIRRYSKTSSDFSKIEVAVLAPAQVLITDSNGKRIGFDPATLTVVEEIPNSMYFFDQALADDSGQNPPPPAGAGVHVAVVSTPQAGNYTIDVIAPDSELYSFAVYGSDRDASLAFNLFEAQPAPGAQPRYNFTYSPIPGAKTLVLQVPIDIKPDETPNPINPKSKGVIPVAILSTDTFDATTVDPLSVRFGPGRAGEAHDKGHIEDVNDDGKPDLMLHFRTQETGIVAEDTKVCLTGKSGLDIVGCDSIQTVP